MSEYMPTTEQIRNAWWRDQCPPNDINLDDIYNAGFDRWLLAHDAEVAARAKAEERERPVTDEMVAEAVREWFQPEHVGTYPQMRAALEAARKEFL